MDDMAAEQITLADARKVRLKPGEVLVIKMNTGGNADMVDFAIEYLRKLFPANSVLVLDHDTEVFKLAGVGVPIRG